MPSNLARLVVLFASVFVCSQIFAAAPSPWQNADIGSVGSTGNAAVADSTFTVSGSGNDIWGTADAFQYVYQPLNGDGEIIARVATGQDTDAWSKAGVMFRETLDANATHALVAVTPSNGISFQWRASTGASCDNSSNGGIVAPAWVRLVRAGNLITAFRSSDGTAWTQVGAAATVAMTQNIFVGLAVTAHNNAQLCTATFDNVRLVIHPTSDGDGLSGTYFNNVDLTGTTVARVDPDINFLWDTGSPSLLIDPDTFSARWLGRVQPYYSEPFTFYTNSDDGVRLWVNHQLLIDNWTNHGPTENSATIQLDAGSTYDIRLEFYENTGGATMQLSWTSPSTPKQIIPQSQLFSTGSDMQFGTGDGLHGDYFNVINLSTSPALSRVDPTVNFNWNGLQPDPMVNAIGFSARWTGQLQAQYSDSYTLSVVADDGVRVWFNGQLQLDKWINEAANEYSFTVDLVAGTKYDIVIEYYQNEGTSVAQLFWSSPMTPKAVIPQNQLYSTGSSFVTGTGTGLFASYFNTINLSGGLAPAFNTPVLTRIEGPIDFNWGGGAPDESINPDNFSIRWIGQIEPQFTETYTFFVNCDDGARLWINNKLIIDAWIDHAPAEFSGTIDLKAGEKVGIKLEYYENAGGALVNLSWSSASRPKITVPQSQLYSSTGLAVQLPTFSVTSPAFFEGIAWSPDGGTALTTANGVNGTFISDNNWFANVPLNANGTATPITVTQTGTGGTQQGAVVWWPLDLAGSNASDHSITIRKGDSLLLTANGNGEILTIDADGDGTTDFVGAPGQTFPYAYNSAGVFTVAARIDGASVGSLVVTVMDADLTKPIADAVGFSRIKHIIVSPTSARGEVVFESGDLCTMSAVNVGNAVDGIDGDVWSINLTANKRGTPVLVARVGGITGPILVVKEVDEFTTENQGLLEAMVNENTGIGGCMLTIRPYIPNVRFQFDMFAHTTTFAGGALEITLNTSDLDPITGAPLVIQSFDASSGEIIGIVTVPLEMPADEDKYCFTTHAFQPSSDDQEVEHALPTNGTACRASVNDIYFCKDDTDGHDLYINLTLRKPTGSSHDVTILNETEPIVPGFTNNNNTATSQVKFQCAGDQDSAQNIGVVVSNGADIGDYDVYVGEALFRGCIHVTSSQVAINIRPTGGVFTEPDEWQDTKRLVLTLSIGTERLGWDEGYNTTYGGVINVVEIQGLVCETSTEEYTGAQQAKSAMRSMFVLGDTIKGFKTTADDPAFHTDDPDAAGVDGTPSATKKIYFGDGPGSTFQFAAGIPDGNVVAYRGNFISVWKLHGVPVSDSIRWCTAVTVVSKDGSWIRAGKNFTRVGSHLPDPLLPSPKELVDVSKTVVPTLHNP